MAKRVEKYPEIVYRKHTQPLSPHPSPWVRQPGRHFPLFLFLICASCGIIAVDVRYGFDWVTELAGKAAAPVVYAVDLVLYPVARSAGIVRETMHARAENRGLHEKVVQLEKELAEYRSAHFENLRLRHLLDLKAQVAPDGMAAEVLRYENSVTRKLMRLRAGKREGFRIGQPVLTEEGQLLGRIVRVSDLVSIVSLITDPSCRIGVTIERTQAQGILYNRNGNLFVRLDRTELISEGDRVVTSHLSTQFPKGLLIGTVTGEADSNEGDPMVAVELGLMKSYRVSPIFPTDRWDEVTEVLCLPVFEEYSENREGSP